MTTKMKLNWRLSKLPTPDEVRELVKDKVITQDEAREILFSQETEEERDKNSLESEIKFLRELVDKLAKGNFSRSGTFTVTNSGASDLATGQYTTSTSDFSSIKTF